MSRRRRSGGSRGAAVPPHPVRGLHRAGAVRRRRRLAGDAPHRGPDANRRSHQGSPRPGGRFILEEWDRDRLLDDATARWYFHQRQAAAATGLLTGDAPLPDRYEEWRPSWLADHGDLHGYTAMRAQLMAPFRERFFTWRPYLYRYGLHESLEPLERALIEEGAIQATGFRWVGELDPPM